MLGADSIYLTVFSASTWFFLISFTQYSSPVFIVRYQVPSMVHSFPLPLTKQENCYAGPTVRPAVPFCCAAFPHTDSCPTGSLNGMHPITIAGNATACNAFLQPRADPPAPSFPALTPGSTMGHSSSDSSKGEERSLLLHWSMPLLLLTALTLLI